MPVVIGDYATVMQAGGKALKYFFAIEVTLFVRLCNQAGNFTYNGRVRAQTIFVAYGQELIRFEYARLSFWR